MGTIDDLCIKTISLLSADGVQQANSGHPGMPMGDAAMAYVLWDKFLKHNPKNPAWPNRDRFVLSAGHGSMLLYSLLHLTGHGISLDDIKNFRQLGSKTPGHPEYCLPCGIETTTGPLGQGFATGVGMAMAEKYLGQLFNKPGAKLIDHYIYGIVSDGDLMEGIASEAASLAGHLGLGKIIYLYSDNKISIEGSTDLAFTEDVQKRFDAYGWQTLRADGADQAGIEKAIKAAQKDSSRPTLILVRTHIGYGSPKVQDSSSAHGSPLGEAELKVVKKAFGFPPNKTFYIPKDVKSHMLKAVSKGKSEEGKWSASFKAYKKKYKELGTLFETLQRGELPEGWDAALPVFKPEDGPVATRSASGKFLNSVAAALPQLIGGSADLAPSNNTELKGLPFFDSKNAARNIHFGVREHAMGAVLNGMALSGMLIPYGGTFLIFSDYLRPALRLSALMGQQCIYVMTHDSIGVGEDGPTHQPIEHLASCRAMPNLVLIRPADANETVEAWKVALTHRSGPVMLSLTRQNVPTIDRKKFAKASGLSKGAYVLKDYAKKPQVILISSGSEVSLCIEAAETLAAEGIGARVVNMASTELFEAQTPKYRQSVLPDDMRNRIAIEAASPFGWERYTGLDGKIIGIDRFGESAPASQVYKHLGITADAVVKAARGMVKKK